MNKRMIWLSIAIIASLSTNAAYAQINGLKTHTRVFNDFTTTTLVTNNGNSVNQGPVLSSASTNETNWSDDNIGGSFANRHLFTFSSDNGATDHFFSINDSYTVSTLINLADGSNSPRKEVGFLIQPAFADAQFIVNSDAGEIVAFGGPFYSFGQNSSSNGYTPGTTILMGYTMTAAGDGNGPLQNTIEYFIDRQPGVPGGESSSGPLPYGNSEGGPPTNYTISLYSQATPNLSNPGEFVTVQFSDIRFTSIPEPATCITLVLGMIGLAWIRGGRTR
jgi:hypothetical protein